MNIKTTIITGILLFSVSAFAYFPIGDAFAKDIYIVNNLDIPLLFKEIKNRQDIQIVSNPPDKVAAGTTGSFSAKVGQKGEDDFKNKHLNIKYYVNNSSSGEQVGIVFKNNVGGSEHCPKDHPDWMTEQVKNCGTWNNNDKKWQYIYSPQ